MFWKGHRHEGEHRGGDARGLQGAVGAVQYLGEWRHRLSSLMGMRKTHLAGLRMLWVAQSPSQP